MKQKVIDINSIQEVLLKSDKLIYGLEVGIQALSMDFGYHIKNTFREPKIFTLRNNISYRLNSSRFHCHLLFRELDIIQSKHTNLKVSKDIKDSQQWHLEIDKRHLSYILDSTVFHLTSVFDYCAILISYITTRTDDQPDWNKIQRHSHANSGPFKNSNTDKIKEAVKSIHSDFVCPLYDYRSDVIHRTADILSSFLSHEYATNKKTLLFLCSPLQQKKFKLGETENKYTLQFFIQNLLTNTIESVANIIRVLRTYMEDNSNNEKLQNEGKVMFAYIGPNKQMVSPSLEGWKVFEKIFFEASADS